MLSELLFGFILWIAVFLFIIAVGSELFAIMVDERLRYLRLIVNYTPLPASISMPTRPEPLVRYASYAIGENRDPTGCVHIRHSGRIRYGKYGRWMAMDGEAFFSIALPGFVWRSTVAWLPGVWLEVFDYYVDREAGTNLNLLSIFPLGNAPTDKMKDGSLFRYLASSPLFPIVHGFSDFIRWKHVDDTTAIAIFHDKDHSVEAIVRFDENGGIESIESGRKIHPETGCPVPGLITSRFSGYTDAGGFRIPVQITSEIIFPNGKEAHAEYVITSIEFDGSDVLYQRDP